MHRSIFFGVCFITILLGCKNQQAKYAQLIVVNDSIIKPNMESKLLVKFFSLDTGRIEKKVVIETNTSPVYKTLTFYGYLKSRYAKH